MNLLLFSAGDRDGEDRISITGRRLAHMRETHRAVVGDILRVGEINGRTGEGTVMAIDEHRAVLHIALHAEPPPKLAVHLVLALPRPKVLRRLLRAAAEFGVRELHLINSFRVEKSYWQTPVLHPAQLREQLLAGLEQARDTRLPEVCCHPRFRPWAEDELPALLAGKRGLLAHPGDYPPCPPQIHDDTVLVVGPEGGFIPFEVGLLTGAGCEPVSLGPRILRVENALAALLGRAV